MAAFSEKGINIYNLIRKVVRGEHTERDLVQTVDLFQKLALSYLRYLQVFGKRIGGDRSDLVSELDDIALDCIAPLFRRDKQGRFVILRAYFGQNLEAYDPDDPMQLLSDIRRLVVKKTKQELARIFRERDPEGARLLRNIRVAVRYSDDLHIFREAGRDWLCYRRHAVVELERELRLLSGGDQPQVEEPSEGGLRRSFPTIPERELRQRFLMAHAANDSVPVSIRKILSIIEELPQYQNCVPVEIVARVIREAHSHLLHSHIREKSRAESPFEHLQDQEIQEVVATVDALIWEKLKRYVWRRKLTLPVAEAYRYALKDVIQDELDHHRRLSYYQHLKHYLPDLAYLDYRTKHRSVFEYLAKLGRRELTARLRRLV